MRKRIVAELLFPCLSLGEDKGVLCRSKQKMQGKTEAEKPFVKKLRYFFQLTSLSSKKKYKTTKGKSKLQINQEEIMWKSLL